MRMVYGSVSAAGSCDDEGGKGTRLCTLKTGPKQAR